MIAFSLAPPVSPHDGDLGHLAGVGHDEVACGDAVLT